MCHTLSNYYTNNIGINILIIWITLKVVGVIEKSYWFYYFAFLNHIYWWKILKLVCWKFIYTLYEWKKLHLMHWNVYISNMSNWFHYWLRIICSACELTLKSKTLNLIIIWKLLVYNDWISEISGWSNRLLCLTKWGCVAPLLIYAFHNTVASLAVNEFRKSFRINEDH